MRTINCCLSLLFAFLSGCGNANGNKIPEQIKAPVVVQDSTNVHKVFEDKISSLLMRRDYESILTACNEHIAINPGYARAYVSRSLAWVAKNKIDKAIADRTKALELLPRDQKEMRTELLRSLGQTYMEQRKHERAMEYFDLWIKDSPASALAYQEKAICHYEMRDLERALACIDRSIELDPNDMVSRRLRTRILLDQIKPDDPIRDENPNVDLKKPN